MTPIQSMILSTVAVFGSAVKLEKRQFQLPSNVNIPIPPIDIPQIPNVPAIPSIPVPTVIPPNIVGQIQSQLPGVPAVPTVPALPFGFDENVNKLVSNVTNAAKSININGYENQAKNQIPAIPVIPVVPSQQDLQKYLDQGKAVVATYLPTSVSNTVTKRSPSAIQTTAPQNNANSNSPFFITGTVGLLWMMS